MSSPCRHAQNPHSRYANVLGWLLLGVSVLFGCGSESGTGNTNWKIECERTEQCNGADVCQCGVCTPRCDGTLDCSQEPEAICANGSIDSGTDDGAPADDTPGLGFPGPDDSPASDDTANDEQSSSDTDDSGATDDGQGNDASAPSGTDDSSGPDDGSFVDDSTAPNSSLPDASRPMNDDPSPENPNANDPSTDEATPDASSSDDTASDDSAPDEVEPPVDADETIDCAGMIGVSEAPKSNYATRTTFIGLQGPVTDSCTADGHLLEHQCEVYSPDPFVGVPAAVSGEVIASVVDCDGRCVDGRCPSGCPTAGDDVTVVGFDDTGAVVIAHESSGRTYSCFLTYQEETIDCTQIANQAASVYAYSFNAGFPLQCTGGIVGKMSLQFPDGACAYEACRILYDDGVDPAPPSPWGRRATPTFSCEDGVAEDRLLYYGGDLTVKSVASAGGTTASDRCTADGNLIEVWCDSRTIGDCVDQPNAPACPRETTGEFLEFEYDCSGHCVDGACESLCPDFFDRFLIESQISDRVVVADLSLGTRYQCTVSTAREGDDATCAALEGLNAYMVMKGIPEPCTSDVVGSFSACITTQPFCQSGHCTFSECTRVWD